MKIIINCMLSQNETLLMEMSPLVVLMSLQLISIIFHQFHVWDLYVTAQKSQKLCFVSRC